MPASPKLQDLVDGLKSGSRVDHWMKMAKKSPPANRTLALPSTTAIFNREHQLYQQMRTGQMYVTAMSAPPAPGLRS